MVVDSKFKYPLVTTLRKKVERSKAKILGTESDRRREIILLKRRLQRSKDKGLLLKSQLSAAFGVKREAFHLHAVLCFNKSQET